MEEMNSYRILLVDGGEFPLRFKSHKFWSDTQAGPGHIFSGEGETFVAAGKLLAIIDERDLAGSITGRRTAEGQPDSDPRKRVARGRISAL